MIDPGGNSQDCRQGIRGEYGVLSGGEYGPGTGNPEDGDGTDRNPGY